jgi:hypothetical protein
MITGGVGNRNKALSGGQNLLRVVDLAGGGVTGDQDGHRVVNRGHGVLAPAVHVVAVEGHRDLKVLAGVSERRRRHLTNTVGNRSADTLPGAIVAHRTRYPPRRRHRTEAIASQLVSRPF